MDGGTTGTPAVRDLYAREASRDGDAVVRRDNVIPDINMDVGRPGHPEAQHRSIEDSAADADAMDIDNTVDDDPIGLQIEAGASDKTAEALQLVGTRTPIGAEATAYTSMSIEELKRAIRAEQSHDSLVRRVRQGLATPIEDRQNLAGPDTANAVPGTANMAMNMAATTASIWSRWQEIDDVVHYDSKVYVPQNTALCNAVISRYHDDIFAGHFGKSRPAELMRRTHDWPGAVRDNPLPVPPELWHTVTMDFITDLPLSSTYGSTTWDSILVVVDKLTKMAHYIPVRKTMSVADFIEVFIQDVVKHHGMPEVLVTDRDKLFTSEKWTSFCFHMRCRHNVSTAFHPQTDGQTERQNQSLEAYLRIFVDEQQED
ncbi:gag polymerase env protein [Lasallia pustulata]|uniref:Gag polymerase env protein n=1 Tax=Lasallia pustulata TaxID=136370 RepID=A0A1W5CY80_9LECA|nr:gag polymerase env protein [Lasallia pustulata]